MRSQAYRLHLSFEGFEWLMYNRTAAYDTIAAALDPGTEHPSSGRHSEDITHPRRTTTKLSGFESMHGYSYGCVVVDLVSGFSFINVPTTFNNPSRCKGASISC